MKFFAIVFLSLGLLFAFIGMVWLYTVTMNDSAKHIEDWIGPLVFAFVGLVFASIGGGVLYFRARQRERREMLIRTGRKLRAVIANMYYNTSITINNRHPLVLECVAEVSGRKHTFKSHNIWNRTDFEVGNEIFVYIDTRDDTNFWVDTGEI
jgi:hypothetical protein